MPQQFQISLSLSYVHVRLVWQKSALKTTYAVPQGFTENQVFATSGDRPGSFWRFSHGINLFGFRGSGVINVIRIPIVVQAVRAGIQYLPPCGWRSTNPPHALVVVAGDTAMKVHSWPGRGLSSGVKSAIARGDEIVHALNGSRFVEFHLTAMDQYNDFTMKLQDSEYDNRIIPLLNQSGTPKVLSWLLSKANTVTDDVPDKTATEWPVVALAQIEEQLEQSGNGVFGPVSNVEPQLRTVLRQMDPATF
ncbi:hypothetical protein CORC01_02999 [Colletotrichum orchidophilum]|uniref:Uncharacterized protein n=1 Tax=Colletotrichum orchidophilum TaxID=1209926 RepID=A0A1G4BKI5_9PEZI|nr:uncharacterized protein CORC01_02999 [Colletotrichum orchidophilum]OHF01808.1 hypothetical protein CORC01_02999 [Colletotrichum orchidophilum]